jgi:antibiotic biosynthesis monooxygenase (ABM) superfamily enzyme
MQPSYVPDHIHVLVWIVLFCYTVFILNQPVLKFWLFESHPLVLAACCSNQMAYYLITSNLAILKFWLLQTPVVDPSAIFIGYINIRCQSSPTTDPIASWHT